MSSESTKEGTTLVVDLTRGKSLTDVKSLLDKNVSAKRVRIELRSEGQACVLMHERDYVVNCIGVVTTRLKNLTHVEIDFCYSVHCDEWFVHCDFPIEGLEQIFNNCGDTLKSLIVQGQHPLEIDGSQKELEKILPALAKAEKLEVLDFEFLSFVVIPEIHTSHLRPHHDCYGYVIDPNGEKLDIIKLLDAIAYLPSLHTLALTFQGCEFEQEKTILYYPLAVESLKSFSLAFYLNRQSNISKEDVASHLNAVLEALLPINDVDLETLQIYRGHLGGKLKLSSKVQSYLSQSKSDTTKKAKMSSEAEG